MPPLPSYPAAAAGGSKASCVSPFKRRDDDDERMCIKAAAAEAECVSIHSGLTLPHTTTLLLVPSCQFSVGLSPQHDPLVGIGRNGENMAGYVQTLCKGKPFFEATVYYPAVRCMLLCTVFVAHCHLRHFRGGFSSSSKKASILLQATTTTTSMEEVERSDRTIKNRTCL